MDKPMNIYQRMSAITAELQTVAKNLTVATSKTASYKAVSERDILDAVKPLETKYGVYSYPATREILESHMLESETQYGTKTTFMSRIKTVYRFVNIDSTNDYIETTVFSEGIDSQDKGSGKAMTYGDKYALMKAYKISTGDDPDQSASDETKYRSKDPDAKKDAEKKKELETTAISAGEAKTLKDLIEMTGTDEKKLLKSYKAATIEALTKAQWAQAVKILSDRKEKQTSEVQDALFG